MKFLKQTASIFLILILLYSCNDSDSSSNTEAATLSVKLVDDPGDYQNVFVEIVDVKIKYDSDDFDEDNEQGWESVGIINPGIYDLLELTGGTNLELVNNETIETGFIKQIRLILGDNNSVLLEGESETRPLSTPSAQQSGLKVMINQNIVSGYNYDFILDFDVDESIVMAGNSGNINLKPVLRASLEVNSGTIAGIVQPSTLPVAVVATNGDFSTTTYTNDLGEFVISGLPEGFYTLTVIPEETLMLDAIVIENIEVNIGTTTSLDPIIFE
ncbi:DUF4382 domain-containing protein [Winogradskyella forsetii]|uniref:DUF4382 domain-containing protein n=1 Tax=Winogradskyella forsetii TaxID=2686077 RepID=UPI0015B7A762|nr:DUF4382 domain-containing protein [Winogradskyella forsetii]